ncbi:hypothetical protein ANO11243_096650 [Dothideomycetidae sp. 11243]|nr:hypothetical protein ANO11243_096650 [fungal sp. No.11243]
MAMAFYNVESGDFFGMNDKDTRGATGRRSGSWLLPLRGSSGNRIQTAIAFAIAVGLWTVAYAGCSMVSDDADLAYFWDGRLTSNRCLHTQYRDTSSQSDYNWTSHDTTVASLFDQWRTKEEAADCCYDCDRQNDQEPTESGAIRYLQALVSAGWLRSGRAPQVKKSTRAAHSMYRPQTEREDSLPCIHALSGMGDIFV